MVMMGVQMSRLGTYFASTDNEIWCRFWPATLPWSAVTAIGVHKNEKEFFVTFVTGKDHSGDDVKLSCTIPHEDCDFATAVAKLKRQAEYRSIQFSSR